MLTGTLSHLFAWVAGSGRLTLLATATLGSHRFAWVAGSGARFITPPNTDHPQPVPAIFRGGLLPLARSGPEDSKDHPLARLPGGAHCLMSPGSPRRRVNAHAGSVVVPGIEVDTAMPLEYPQPR